MILLQEAKFCHAVQDHQHSPLNTGASGCPDCHPSVTTDMRYFWHSCGALVIFPRLG